MASSAKRLKRAKVQSGPDFTGTTRAVRVEDEIFQVHQKLACATSDFFKNDASIVAIDIEQNPIRIHGHTAATFRIYLAWLYTKQMGHIIDMKYMSHTMVRAFLMGITLLDTTFHNAVVASMTQRACVGGYPDLSIVKEVYVERPTLLYKVRDPAAEMHGDFVNDPLRAFFKPPMSRSVDEKPWLTDPHRYLEVAGQAVAVPNNPQGSMTAFDTSSG